MDGGAKHVTVATVYGGGLASQIILAGGDGLRESRVFDELPDRFAACIGQRMRDESGVLGHQHAVSGLERFDLAHDRAKAVHRQIHAGNPQGFIPGLNGHADAHHQHILPVDRIAKGFHDDFLARFQRAEVIVTRGGGLVVIHASFQMNSANAIPISHVTAGGIVSRLIGVLSVPAIQGIRFPHTPDPEHFRVGLQHAAEGLGELGAIRGGGAVFDAPQHRRQALGGGGGLVDFILNHGCLRGGHFPCPVQGGIVH